MDVIAILFVLISVIGAVAKNAKKTAEKRPGQAQRPQAAPPKKAGYDPARKEVDWEEAFPPEVREVLARERGKGAAKKYTLKPRPTPVSAAKPAAEGASPVFADGCVGGSLPHDDRPPRQRATPREQAPDTLPVLLDAASHVKSQPKLTAAEMRRAVITAEALARPVALRPHGYRL